MKYKGASSLVWILAVVALLVVTGSIPQISDLLGGKSITQPTRTTAFCGDDNLADIQVRIRNILAESSSNWINPSLSLIDGEGNIKTSYTPNTDGTFATTANALECGKRYSVAVVNDATYVAVRSVIKTIDSSQVQFDVNGANSSQVNFNTYTLSYGNETNGAANSQDYATPTNNAMGTGSTLTLRYDVGLADSSAQFGSLERICEEDTGVCGSAFVCITGDSSIYAKEDVSITGEIIAGKTASLPKLCAVSSPANAGTGLVAYEVAPWSSGRKSGTLTVKSSLGNPSDTQNVRYIFMDNSYYNSFGKLSVGTANDANSDTGETNRYFQIDIT